MSDDSVQTVRAKFSTRQAAELAIEHLTQEYGIDRADIFVQPAASANTSGTSTSGGDAASARGDDARNDGSLDGEIEVFVDISAGQTDNAHKALEQAGASSISSS
jgi:hypothetical protein